MDFRNINKGNNKSSNVKRSAAKFLERQGFYIVLMVCLVIIGITAFLALNGQQKEVPQAELPSAQEEQVNQSLDQPLANVSTPVAAAQPTMAATPMPTSKPSATGENIVKVSAPVSGKIIFAFASDSLLYSTTLKQWTTHLGVDIAVAQGTDVKSVLSGTVEKVDKDDWLGNRVTIKHDNNKKTVYCNLQDGVSVKKGDVITAGKVIGKVGNSATSECAEESHLHFEFYVNGKAVDPGKYVNFK